MTEAMPKPTQPRHLTCIHMTKYAGLGFATTMLIWEVIVSRDPGYVPLKFTGIMLPAFLLALWLTVNTVGRKLYQPQTKGNHMCLAYLGTVMICYLTPTLYFLGYFGYNWTTSGNTVRASEYIAALIYYPAIGMVFGIPGAVIFGTMLGLEVHKKIGVKA